MSKHGGFSGPYFPVFGLNNGKIRTRKNSVCGHSLRSDKHHIFRKHEITMISPSTKINQREIWQNLHPRKLTSWKLISAKTNVLNVAALLRNIVSALCFIIDIACRCRVHELIKATDLTMWLQQPINICQDVTWQIGKKRVQNNRHQIAMNRSSEVTYFVSSETYEHLITMLILGCRIGFNFILYLLLVNQ